MSSPYAEAFPLLTLHDVLLATTSGKERGPMVLECVTLSHGSGSSPVDRDVVLVLRVNALEVVVDPRRQITLSDEPGSPRVYTFHGLVDDPAEITLTLPWLANPDSKASSAAADIDTFDQVLTQYANFTPQAAHAAPLANSHTTFEVEDGDEDLRGRLVLVDQVNGEVMGAVGEKGAVRADPMLQKTGHEQDAVVIDMGQDEELGARQMFAQAIPPDQHDAITRTASMLSTGISGATNLLVAGLNTASSFYISRAQPHPSASPSRDGVAPPLPPRAIQWLTSADGRNSLNTAQSYTGKARQVTGRTAAAVEGVIARAMGNNKGKNRAVPPPPPPRRNDQSMFDPNMPATYTSSPTTPTEKGHAYGGYPASSAASATGVLPPYSSTTSLAAPAAGTRRVPPPPPTYSSSAPPSRTSTPSGAKETPGEKLTRKARLVLSAQLVLSTLDASGKKIVDVGSDRLAAVVGHKYGTEAANSTRIMTGAARNVVLVYIDVTGLGRRALIKTAGKHFIKAKIGGKEYKLKTDANGQVVEAQPVNEKA